MKSRRRMARAARYPKWQKLGLGGLIIFLILGLSVSPLYLFSTASPTSEANDLSAASADCASSSRWPGPSSLYGGSPRAAVPQ